MEEKLDISWIKSILGRNFDSKIAKESGWKGRKNKDIKKWTFKFYASEQSACYRSTSIEINIITDLQGRIEEVFPILIWFRIDNLGGGHTDTLKVSFDSLKEQDIYKAIEVIKPIIT